MLLEVQSCAYRPCPTPQQRLLLEAFQSSAAFAASSGAGVAADGLPLWVRGGETAVLVGSQQMEYKELMTALGLGHSPFAVTAGDLSVAAGRIR